MKYKPFFDNVAERNVKQLLASLIKVIERQKANANWAEGK